MEDVSFPHLGGEGMITRWEMSLSIMVGSVGDVSYHCKGGGGGGDTSVGDVSYHCEGGGGGDTSVGDVS